MDGGRRLLRSLTQFSWSAALPAIVAPRANQIVAAAQAKPRLPVVLRQPLPRASRMASHGRILGAVARPGAGLMLSLLLLASAGMAGAVGGGRYDAFTQANGPISDVLARAVGFGLSAVVITSDNGMANDVILRASGVTTHSSLLFLAPADVRARLKSVPLVKEASVRKLYPDRLVIDIEERQPFALWQKDGEIAVISADGTPIDRMRDDRFASLPFVVGDGANLRAAEYAALLEAAGELRGKIRAGILISGRRWNLKMANGVDVKLPETGALKSLASLAQLEREAHVLEKDVVSLDLRMPGRMIARLTTDALASRAETLAARKQHGKAGQT